jgi:hypothetical protein
MQKSFMPRWWHLINKGNMVSGVMIVAGVIGLCVAVIVEVKA